MDIRISNPEFLSKPPGFLAGHLCKSLSNSKNPFQTEWKLDDNFQGTDDPRYLEDLTACQWLIRSLKRVVNEDRTPLYYQVSLSSPMNQGNMEGLDAVTDACRILESEYQHSADREGIPNLRVEVAHASEPLPVDTLKKIMGFLWTFEKVINTIHPPHVLESKNPVPLRRNCDLSRLSSLKSDNGKPKFSPAEILDKLFACKTTEELVALTSHPDPQVQQTFSAKQFLQPDLYFPSFEFNQHEATLDAYRVELWVKFCWGLVDFVHRYTYDAVHQNLRDITVNEIEITLDDLLGMLGVLEEGEIFAGMVYTHTDELYTGIPSWNPSLNSEDDKMDVGP